ncbi:uncharacterized protein LOC121241550 isoform X1 [Juglans microcarpa x Juglans regia]|uniref:uncharacterized protein LOC121241550 isoform X1 n=1 Tax=Juglans microcarpa x Juglans regia TaxID=2249226 RepID=UPI001B7E6AA1|nr:uncharacterized protein LOC121241550 isoform X1 [Juglans microcarpa x Juglans regia]XP_040995310.1 uncharacterized protein LOC121241550 isoform X1 [Juglans microcarpa x Juglans regia]
MEPNVNTPDIQTQFLDSQYSPPSFSVGEKVETEDADELKYLESTVPFDATVTADDAFGTQLVNLAGETQVLSIAGETQVYDDAECSENMATQLFDVFDNQVAGVMGGKGTEEAQDFGDSDEQSDDESIRSDGGQSVDGEKIYNSLHEHHNKGLLERFDPLPDKEHITEVHVSTATCVVEGSLKPKPGPIRLGFTSVRVASLRASALAARMTLKGISNGSCSPPSKNQSLGVGEEVDQEHDIGQCNGKTRGSKNKNLWVGSRTARKLFTEDSHDDCRGLPLNLNNVEGEELPHLPACDDGLAGLSYVDSQEPGELSQANALTFLEGFLKDNVGEFEQADCVKKIGGKPNSVSSTEGLQGFAKKAIDRNIIGEAAIFDWDDSREHEGGGEIFRSRNEEFFYGGGHGRKSFTLPWKPEGSRLDENRDHEENLDFDNNRTGLAHSESKLMWHNSKVSGKTVQTMKLKKTLVSESDKEFSDHPCGQSENNGTETDVPEMSNIGFDTQMAAEAMEALFHGESIANHDDKDAYQGNENNVKGSCRGSLGGNTNKVIHLSQPFCRKGASLSDIGFASLKNLESMSANSRKESSISLEKHSDNVRKQSGVELVRKQSKRVHLIAEECLTANGNGNSKKKISKTIGKRKAGGTFNRSCTNESNRYDGSGVSAVKKQHLQGEVGACASVSRQTRQLLVGNHLKKTENASGDSREELNYPIEVCALIEKSNSSSAIQASEVLEETSSILGSNQSRKVRSIKSSQHDLLAPELIDCNNGSIIDSLRYPRRRRSHRNLSGQENGFDCLDGVLEPSVRLKYIQNSVSKRKRSWGDAKIPFVVSNLKKTRSGHASIDGKSGDVDVKIITKDLTDAKAGKDSERNSDASCPSSTGKVNSRLDESPRERCKPSDFACTTPTPVNCKTPENAASPVCMGSEYFKLSCRRNLSRPNLLKEICSLSAAVPELASVSKASRKRRDMSDVRVFYSHHLDEDIMKQQKKILARLGFTTVSSIMDATHFIADQFVRTRNILEAIASGKPVVTHLWLESCGQASCFIDEKNYILRDAKKEREFGFCMPVSLARASQHPLLEGRRVFITPNIKPSKETISSLVKAAQGQAVERTCRSSLKKDDIPENLLVLSCEEDYVICVPFLEKGAAVYSSELLLNGIVTQKLEYERHRLFADHVRKTHSTVWIGKEDNQFLPVTKHK